MVHGPWSISVVLLVCLTHLRERLVDALVKQRECVLVVVTLVTLDEGCISFRPGSSD